MWAIGVLAMTGSFSLPAFTNLPKTKTTTSTHIKFHTGIKGAHGARCLLGIRGLAIRDVSFTNGWGGGWEKPTANTV